MRIRNRVWIVEYRGAPPERLRQVPSEATAIEPAERRTMTPREARHYVDAFNRQAQRGTRKIWAVAVPVALRIDGDLEPGREVESSAEPSRA